MVLWFHLLCCSVVILYNIFVFDYYNRYGTLHNDDQEHDLMIMEKHLHVYEFGIQLEDMINWLYVLATHEEEIFKQCFNKTISGKGKLCSLKNYEGRHGGGGSVFITLRYKKIPEVLSNVLEIRNFR